MEVYNSSVEPSCKLILEQIRVVFELFTFDQEQSCSIF